MNIINTTPHNVVIYDDEMNIIKTFEPSISVRCKQTETETGSIDGIPTVSVEFGEIEGLPEPQEDTIYIVSQIVKRAGEQVGRKDLFVPARPVRDEQGRIIGCKALG